MPKDSCDLIIPKEIGYIQGYSQHMIAKVLGLNQATVQRIIKRVKTQ